MQFVQGQKQRLDTLISLDKDFSLEVVLASTLTIDVALFGLDSDSRLSDESYMIFYNQPKSPCSAIEFIQKSASQTIFSISLNKLSSKIERLIVTLAIDSSNAQDIMSKLNASHFSILNKQNSPIAKFAFSGNLFTQERAIMLFEIYKKDGIWRATAVAQGFNGGLDKLIEHFGGEVAKDEKIPMSIIEPLNNSVIPPKPSLSNIDLKKKISLEKAEKTGNASIINLTKKSLVELEKKNLLEVQARVALVLDASGSMNWQYKNGDVQKVVDRLMPLAISFDNDGSFECWAFGQKTQQLDDVNLTNVSQFINTAQKGWQNWQIGYRINEEIPAIESVINYYQQFNDNLPVYVLFISDGGVSSGRKMQKTLIEAAKLPIFWQFVGIGGRNYGVLEKLDDMTDRVVDNCNFFDLDNIGSVSDEKLYELLLEEFPDWLKNAKQLGIIR